MWVQGKEVRSGERGHRNRLGVRQLSNPPCVGLSRPSRVTATSRGPDPTPAVKRQGVAPDSAMPVLKSETLIQGARQPTMSSLDGVHHPNMSTMTASSLTGGIRLPVVLRSNGLFRIDGTSRICRVCETGHDARERGDGQTTGWLRGTRRVSPCPSSDRQSWRGLSLVAQHHLSVGVNGFCCCACCLAGHSPWRFRTESSSGEFVSALATDDCVSRGLAVRGWPDSTGAAALSWLLWAKPALGPRRWCPPWPQRRSEPGLVIVGSVANYLALDADRPPEHAEIVDQARTLNSDIRLDRGVLQPCPSFSPWEHLPD